MNFFQSLVGTKASFLIIQALVLRAELNVLQNSRLEELMLRILEDHSDTRTQSFLVEVTVRDVFTIEVYMTLSRSYKTIESLNHRGFAASCMTDDTDEIALVYLNRDISQRLCLSAAILVNHR